MSSVREWDGGSGNSGGSVMTKSSGRRKVEAKIIEARGPRNRGVGRWEGWLGRGNHRELGQGCVGERESQEPESSKNGAV